MNYNKEVCYADLSNVKDASRRPLTSDALPLISLWKKQVLVRNEVKHNEQVSLDTLRSSSNSERT